MTARMGTVQRTRLLVLRLERGMMVATVYDLCVFLVCVERPQKIRKKAKLSMNPRAFRSPPLSECVIFWQRGFLKARYCQCDSVECLQRFHMVDPWNKSCSSSDAVPSYVFSSGMALVELKRLLCTLNNFLHIGRPLPKIPRIAKLSPTPVPTTFATAAAVTTAVAEAVSDTCAFALAST